MNAPRLTQALHQALLVAAIALLVTLTLFVADARKRMDYTAENANRAIRESAQTVANLRHATEEWEKSSKQQAAYFTQAAEQSNELIAQARTDLAGLGKVIDRADGAVAHLDAAIVEQNANATAAAAALEASLGNLAPAVKSATESLDNVAKITGDPAIADTLANIQKTSAEAAGIAADAHTETGLIVQQTRQAFKPKNKFLAVLQMLGNGTISGAELYFYLTH